MTKKLICPACKKEIKSFKQAQEGILWYRYDFDNKQWESDEHDGKDILGYFCDECGNEFTSKVVKQIEKLLNY